MPSNAIIRVTAHAEPDESRFVIRSPIAARIHPQIKKISRLADNKVARTGIAFSSINIAGLA